MSAAPKLTIELACCEGVICREVERPGSTQEDVAKVDALARVRLGALADEDNVVELDTARRR